MNEERATQAFEINSNGAPSALDQLRAFTHYLLLQLEGLAKALKAK